MGVYDFFATLFGFFVSDGSAPDWVSPLCKLLSVFASACCIKLVLDVPIAIIKNWKNKLRGDQ